MAQEQDNRQQSQQTPPPAAAKGGLIKNLLILIMAPLSVAGVLHIMPFLKAAKAEYKAGTNLTELQSKWESGGWDEVKHMFDKQPEMGVQMLIHKAVSNDDVLKEAVKNAAGRLSGKKMTRGEARFLLKHIDDKPGATPAKKDNK